MAILSVLVLCVCIFLILFLILIAESITTNAATIVCNSNRHDVDYDKEFSRRDDFDHKPKTFEELKDYIQR